MLLVGILLLLLIVIVLRLTGGGPWPKGKTRAEERDWIAQQVLDVCSDERVSRQMQDRKPLLGGILVDLMERLGVAGENSANAMRVAGFRTDELVRPRSNLAVRRRGRGIEEALERAFLVGIQIARTDDDYARVGDEFLDLERLARRAEAVDLELFSETGLEGYSLCGKAAIVLQDMMAGEPEGARREVLIALLQVFDDRIRRFQEEMSAAMAKISEPETLLWGEAQDRRLYYFKLGVTNSLRRSSALKSLAHLYRLKGVNYDVEEAYRLASQECPALAIADGTQIEKLLQMGPGEIHGLIYRRLPPGDI